MSKIIFTVNGTDIVFAPNTQDYNKFINEMAMDNKVAPAHNYLMRIVEPDSKEALKEILNRPGAAIQLAGKINESFAPELEIILKN